MHNLKKDDEDSTTPDGLMQIHKLHCEEFNFLVIVFIKPLE